MKYNEYDSRTLNTRCPENNFNPVNIIHCRECARYCGETPLGIRCKKAVVSSPTASSTSNQA
jgi:hypothetical protein